MESLCTSSPMNRRGPLAATGAAGWGRGERLAFFGSDRFGLRRFFCFLGVFFPIVCCLGLESHNWWLGTAHAAQPTLTPESRHLICFHRQPYCLGIMDTFDIILVGC